MGRKFRIQHCRLQDPHCFTSDSPWSDQINELLSIYRGISNSYCDGVLYRTQSRSSLSKHREDTYAWLSADVSQTHYRGASSYRQPLKHENQELLLCVWRWLRCLHCRLTARRSWVWFPHGALLVLGGSRALSAPDLSAQVGLSRAFLCGVCMFSPCSRGVSSTKNPNRKTCKRTEHCPVRPWPRWTVHFTWSLGA